MKELKLCGSTISKMSISLEKRFSILPTGVWSNNSIGHLITFSSKISCNWRDASMHPSAKIIDDVKEDVTKEMFIKIILMLCI